MHEKTLADAVIANEGKMKALIATVHEHEGKIEALIDTVDRIIRSKEKE